MIKIKKTAIELQIKLKEQLKLYHNKVIKVEKVKKD